MRNLSNAGARHKARVSRFSDPRDKVNPAELAAQAARLQKTETVKKSNNDEIAQTSSNVTPLPPNLRLDLNQFLRREVSKDMVELLKQVNRARSRSIDSSTSSNAKKSHSKKHKKHSSKKSRRRSSSTSSSSSASSSSSSNKSSSRKHKKKSKSSRSKKDKKHRSRSRSRDSHRSGKSYSRDRYRDRR